MRIRQCIVSGPRQPIPGTRYHRYRCSLPGLAEFTADRREKADADRRRLSPLAQRNTNPKSAPEVSIFFDDLRGGTDYEGIRAMHHMSVLAGIVQRGEEMLHGVEPGALLVI